MSELDAVMKNVSEPFFSILRLAQKERSKMTTLQELSMKEIFEIRDAIVILEKYGYIHTVANLRKQVDEAIADFRDGRDR